MSNLFELRRYRLKPGAFDDLLTLFEREFVHTQQAVGIDVPAIYRDVDDPNGFVWLRSFENIDARAEALATFYNGEAWNRFGSAANATMVNSDNVLLLAPGRLGSDFVPTSARRTSAPVPADKGLVTTSICSLAPGREQEFAAFFETEARPLIEQAGARIDATFVTAAERNSFPRLPVREGEPVFVWISAFSNAEAEETHRSRLRQSAAWQDRVFPELDRRLWRRIETARLIPTGRSRHRWRGGASS